MTSEYARARPLQTLNSWTALLGSSAITQLYQNASSKGSRRSTDLAVGGGLLVTTELLSLAVDAISHHRLHQGQPLDVKTFLLNSSRHVRLALISGRDPLTRRRN